MNKIQQDSINFAVHTFMSELEPIIKGTPTSITISGIGSKYPRISATVKVHIPLWNHPHAEADREVY